MANHAKARYVLTTMGY